jgi:Ca2+/H+ antiporter
MAMSASPEHPAQGHKPGVLMYLVAIAWIYVVVMMAAAEASATNGSVIGALVTLLLYGVLPLSVAIYLMRTPVRRRARAEAEAAAQAAARSAAGVDPDGSGHPPGDTVPAVRKES